MQPPKLPENEQARLNALSACSLLDTEAEERFDRLTEIAQALFDVPVVLVSLVDAKRQWFKSKQGLDATETPRSISFCGHAILRPQQLFIVENALEDERFSDNPLVTGDLNIRFYAGAPIKDSGGYPLGTLCLIDSQPRQLSDKQKEMFRHLAALVEQEIQYQDVTELNQQIRQSRDQYASLVENIPGITYRCRYDEHWTMLFMSSNIDPVSGYPASDFINNARRSYASLIPDNYHEYVEQQVAEAVEQKRSWQFEYPICHADGKLRWIEERGKAIYDGQGNVAYLQGFLLDITRERQARERLERHNRVLKLLNRISFELKGTLTEVIEQALELGCEFLQMDMAIVSEVLADTYVVRWFSQPQEGELTHGQQFQLTDTYCDITLRENTLVAIEHMQKSDYCGHSCYQAFGLESYIAQPLNVDGKAFGTLNFSSLVPREQGFDDIDKLFVRLLERWLGGKLDRDQQRRKLNNLVEQVPGMIYQFRQWPDGKVAFPYSSSGIQDIYGVTAEQIKKDGGVVFERIFSEDRERVSDSIQQSAQSLELWHEQYRVLNEKQQPEWVEGRARPQRLDDGSTLWFGYIANIHQSKKIELSLESSEQRLRSLFELSPIGILLVDYKSGKLLDCNAALLNPSGYSRQKLLQQSIMDLVPDSHRYLRNKMLDEIRNHGQFGPVDVELRCQNNDTYPIRFQGVKISDEEQQSLLWCLIEDITEHKRIERMQKEFISMVSHELRTPLTSIKGVLSLLTGGAVQHMPEKARTLLSTAYRNSVLLNELINDILDLEKLSAGAIHFAMQAIEVATLLQEAKELYQHYGLKQGVTIRLIPAKEDLCILADKKYLLQGLANLLSNAIKFSPERAVVTLFASRVGQQIRISVQDQGEGVPEAFRDRIFTRFAQADSSDNRQKGGTGLGLAITRELMEQMGGEVDFESVDGEGATFWLQLPDINSGASDL
ncbi:PAS domain-containing protein [Lacimicrobium alkaliphilum]|uniref:histidine kinase n=1 Tax=Lacimicrobium alkaliphilum TaxID=1526571 RepID=A0ABQ1R9J1_9ALTE|nr:PAS domain-containing protein [Lacimicrobium alkaliphilum]GGD61092.1 hypothetical protein GCM10011357_15490 [Lacimicrobium alkaliphilum]